MSKPPPPPPGSEYANALRAVLEHTAQVEAAAGPMVHRPPMLTRPPVMMALAVVFVGVVFWDVRAMRQDIVPPTPQEQVVAQGLSLLAVGQAVEAYRREHGALPESLEQVGFPAGDFQYVRTGETFEIRAAGAAAGPGYRGDTPVPDLVRDLIPPDLVR